MSKIRTKPAIKLNENYFQKIIDSTFNLIDNQYQQDKMYDDLFRKQICFSTLKHV